MGACDRFKMRTLGMIIGALLLATTTKKKLRGRVY